MPVQVERRPPLRHVHLDTGPRNVLTLEAVEALGAALEADAEAPVAILSGRADGFCAGLDNRTLAAGAAERESLLAAMGELLHRVLSGPTRIVAACEGHAVAAGAMLLLISDVRLGVAGRYKLGFTEPSLGMPLPELPALLAHMRLDRRRLHELTALGRVIGPEEAVAAGFFDALVPAEALRDLAEQRAAALATLTDAAYLGSLRAAWGDTLPRIGELAQAQVRRRDAARG